MPQINICSKYVLVYYYISAVVMMLPHFTEFICFLCIDNEHFRSGEVPSLRSGNHAVGINEVLKHGFFIFAWFIFSIVTELKLLSVSVSPPLI